VIRAERLWVFNGARGTFPGGIFTDLDRAEHWIEEHRLTGTLTAYPVDVGVFEWAIAEGLFRPRKPHETSPEFIGRFTSASMEHHHYEDGRRQDRD
jgi:hypothetical protein